MLGFILWLYYLLSDLGHINYLISSSSIKWDGNSTYLIGSSELIYIYNIHAYICIYFIDAFVQEYMYIECKCIFI